MQPKIKFETSEEACKALKQEIGDYSARPYNFRSPDSTEWWLISKKKKDWPAYHLGKAHFNIENTEDPRQPQMFIAFYVEKGVGRSAAEFVPSQYVMGADPVWVWEQFVKDFRRGRVPDAIEKMARETKCKPEILIEAHIVPPSSRFDPEARYDLPSEFYWLEWDPATKKYSVIDSDPSSSEPRLSDYSKCETHSDLGDCLVNDSKQDWLWIDLFIGLTFDMVAPKSRARGVWTALDIRNRLLWPFLRWME